MKRERRENGERSMTDRPDFATNYEKEKSRFYIAFFLALGIAKNIMFLVLIPFQLNLYSHRNTCKGRGKGNLNFRLGRFMFVGETPVCVSHVCTQRRGGTGIAYISPSAPRPRVLREIEGHATDYRSGVTRYKGGGGGGGCVRFDPPPPPIPKQERQTHTHLLFPEQFAPKEKNTPTYLGNYNFRVFPLHHI